MKENVENLHKRYTIVYKKNECIGTFACVAAEPDTWKRDSEEDKADLIGGNLKIGDEEEVYIKEVDELDNNLEAAQSCPVNCIHIIDNNTGRKII